MRIYKKPYKPDYIKAIARDLRKNLTKSELYLWNALKEKKFYGYRFRRQAPFGRYIFDFYCPKKRFAIEIDGDSHRNKEEYDKLRDEYVSSCKVKVARFTDSEVMNNLEEVLDKIKIEIGN